MKRGFCNVVSGNKVFTWQARRPAPSVFGRGCAAGLVTIAGAGRAPAQQGSWTPRWLPPCKAYALAYDARHGSTILFGGDDGLRYNGKTFRWMGNRWIPIASNGPSPVGYCPMVYDTARQVTMFFGGIRGNETWTWNGSAWTDV